MTETNFGKTLRKARLAQEITLREAAKRLEISAAYLSGLENNSDGSTPDESLLQKMAKLLKLDFIELKTLAASISKNNLRSLDRLIDANEAKDIQAFYRVAKQNNVSIREAVRIFTDAVQQHNSQRGK